MEGAHGAFRGNGVLLASFLDILGSPFTPVLQRKGKAVIGSNMTTSSSIVVDLEEPRWAGGGWLLVERLLVEFEVIPGVILNELRCAWRLHGNVTPRRVSSNDGWFVLRFEIKEI